MKYAPSIEDGYTYLAEPFLPMDESCQLPKIAISRFKHHGKARIKIIFPYHLQLIEWIRNIPGRAWSSSKRCWHIPEDSKGYALLLEFADSCENESLKNQILLAKNEWENSLQPLPSKHRKKIENYNQYLNSMRYSDRTKRVYNDALVSFLKFFGDLELDSIQNKDIVKYHHEHILKKGYSSSYQNQVISALKLFFRTVENKTIQIEEIERPRRSLHLPEVLSIQEVECLLSNIQNIKHKAMLSLVYACGLRRSELLNLRINAINSKRNLLTIKEAKGKKDRVAPLSNKLIDMLRDYYKKYRPSYWLFEGQKAGTRYSEGSIQKVFQRAAAKAGIQRAISLHTLRHSYATHLLENGVELRYIQELLGHKSSRTTEIYTHVSMKSLEKIKSPFDQLTLK